MAAAAAASSAPAGDSVPLVLVTGASGFVGSHCVRVLLAGGFRVRGTVRDPKDDAKTAPLRELEGASDRLELVAANLMKDDGWTEAVAGAMYVLHVASPFPITAPKHKDDLIRPAVDGTLRVLKAAAAEACVRRVVLTSSVASITEGRSPAELKDRTFSEEDWSDLESGCIAAYPESKTRAERAAWEFIKSGQPEGRGLELATINPSFIVGPMIRRSPCSSVEVVQNLMERKFSIIPDVNLWCVDVRDVAEAHVRAMVLPAAAGKRFLLSTREYGLQEVRSARAAALLLICAAGRLTARRQRCPHCRAPRFQPSGRYSQMGVDLAAVYNPKGYSVPTAKASNWLIHVAGWFSATAAATVPRLGVHEKHNHAQAEAVLGVRWRDVKTAVAELAASGVALGLIQPPKGAAALECPPLGDVRTEGISVEDVPAAKES
ncbi:TKPR1 [Symbiodinium sp. KB8]|nr:TKPR1 [Symbiodinium sp. KB8]